MELNDLLIPANEKIDTNILDRTLKKTMTLYHGTDKELTVISPTSINVGNRLSPIHRKSSFWTKDFDYAVIWALDWVAMRSNLSYFHDIENRKFVVPPLQLQRKGDSKIYWAEEWMLVSLEQHPVYVYEATIPTKYIGRGQYPIDEYTVDVDVTPKRKIVITPEIAEPYIQYCEKYETFAREVNNNRGVLAKEKPSFLEKVIFFDPKKTHNKRRKIYYKQQNASESFVELCDTLIIEE